MLISHQHMTADVFHLRKLWNVNFTGMHDHKDVYSTWGMAESWFYEALEADVLSPDQRSLKHYKSADLKLNLCYNRFLLAGDYMLDFLYQSS